MTTIQDARDAGDTSILTGPRRRFSSRNRSKPDPLPRPAKPADHPEAIFEFDLEVLQVTPVRNWMTDDYRDFHWAPDVCSLSEMVDVIEWLVERGHQGRYRLFTRTAAKVQVDLLDNTAAVDFKLRWENAKLVYTYEQGWIEFNSRTRDI